MLLAAIGNENNNTAKVAAQGRAAVLLYCAGAYHYKSVEIHFLLTYHFGTYPFILSAPPLLASQLLKVKKD
ncbi:hypothetical protein GPLA_0696 [Paraglaciecola polaris LMG 21857]|uniref:Uncharacterized protein n=1 Tax=Paraglaciecola polaris LMG 21857 TaxID=1129793 RepID=K6ZMR5_9ALTE|nr:hypothetical protein GPLA_0696 [Paraglaciecola polaris LMG 21857]